MRCAIVVLVATVGGCLAGTEPARVPVEQSILRMAVVSFPGFSDPLTIEVEYTLPNSCHAAGEVEVEKTDAHAVVLRALSSRVADATLGCRPVAATTVDTVEVVPPFTPPITVSSILPADAGAAIVITSLPVPPTTK